MNRAQAIETLKFSCSNRRSRIPVRVYDVLMNIENLTPGLDGAVIQKARKQFEFLWQYDEKTRERKGGLVVLAGPVGIGKTVAATFLACMMVEADSYSDGDRRHSIRNAPEFWFVPAQMIVDNAYSKDVVPNGMKPNRLKDLRSILVVDDIGREYIKKDGWSMTVVDEFFDSRYRENLPTIATTNLNEYEFKERYGERIWDRFQEWGRWIYSEGVSLRCQ